ncbi:superoxide dismutase family protein [Pelomicrobium sp.]|jgi:Cu-Zn family superoxide dismutase|uniref:superoxide dismutase family protein n=1 Tax=Pelomicrobium sp. TaxID=2815319 RepID=UPI002FDD3C9E
MNNATLVATAAVFLSACAYLPFSSGPSATAELKPLKGSGVNGTVHFTQKGDKVLVVAEVKGLKPGPHGFHIHEKGDCSAPDGMSAGGHFNPHGKKHGGPNDPDRHAGDLGNLVADASGNAKLTLETADLSIGSGPGNLLGRSVIVHADPDDFKTQPHGNAGARIACGLIVAKGGRSAY